MARRGRRFGRLLTAGIVALALQACALATVGTEAAPDIYVLTTPEVALGEGRTRLPVQLVVEEPYAPAALNSNRIVYQPSPNEINYFGKSRWSDRTPLMLQVLLVDALDQSGMFKAVGRRAAGMRSDYLVRLSILTFAAEKDGTDLEHVRIHINAQLVRRFSDTIVAGMHFEAQAQPESTRMIDVVGAFDAATSTALGDLSIWLYDEISRVADTPG